MVHIRYVNPYDLWGTAEWELLQAEMNDRLNPREKCPGYADSTGWLDVQKWADRKQLDEIDALAQEIRQQSEVFAVVGIGGSNQGARAIIDACSWREQEGPEILYPALYLSAAEYRKFWKNVGNRSLTIDVIAKNFKTLEPGTFFRLLRDDLSRRYPSEEARSRIIVTPTLGLDALDSLGREEGYRTLPFPEDVGGRYAVFTPVGLLPVAVAGCDIHALIQGAMDAQADFEQEGSLSREVRQYALCRNVLYRKGFGIEASVFFEPCLQSLGKWWRQLFGESEGKDGKGIFPTILLYTEELHSLGQYVQDGKRQIMETFVHVRKPMGNLTIGNGQGLQDGFDYLEGRSLYDINEAAYQATLQAHSEGGVPCHVIELDSMDEYHLGMYMYAMMRACYESSLILGVNPFDQPGVEAYKQKMFSILKGREE